MIVNLDSIEPDRLVCPADRRRIEYVDTTGTGLYLECRRTNPGHGTFYLRYKDANGKTCHAKIGRSSSMTVDEARRRVQALRTQIDGGADPRAEEKARKAVLTFDTFFDQYYMPQAKVRKRTWKRDAERYALRLKGAFGHKRLNQITRHEIQAFHIALRNDGLSPAYADHFVKLLRRALNLAIEIELLETNPAAGIRLFNADNKVEHYMNDEELKRLLAVLRDGTDRNRKVRLIALYLLSTGARLNEALKAKWQDIDRDHRVWRIPASTSKNKRVRSVPLNDSALGVLDQLESDTTYLFTNERTGKPYANIHKVWERLRIKAGLPHLRIHDLRHQYASFLVNSGRTLYEVQQILGHSDPSVTTRYAVLSTKTL